MLDSTGITQIAARKRVGIFFPFADLWTHQRAIHLLARRWSSECDIAIVSCDAQRTSPCPAQRSLGLSESSPPELRDLVCNRCQTSTELTRSVRYYSIGDFAVTPVELPKHLTELLNFQLDGLPLGRVAVYDLLLAMKCAPQEVPESSAATISAAVSDTVDIYLRMKKLIAQEKFDCLVLNNELYAMNAAASLAATALGVDTFNLHLGTFRSKLDRSIYIQPGRVDYLSVAPDFNLPSEEYDSVERNFGRLLRREYKNRFYRRHALTYSPRARRFVDRGDRGNSVDRYRASLVLSSPDEQYTYRFVRGLPQDDFSQLGVLETFFELAKKNPNERFLIRLHPRLLSNHRDVKQSSAFSSIHDALDRSPTNIDIDGLNGFRPILSVLQKSQVILVSWSSLALDAALLGIPVVLCKKLGTAFTTVAVEVDGPSVEHLTEAISRAESRTTEEHQRHAVDFWLRTWREHRFARALPIRLSPALLALWLATRLRLSGLEKVHSRLRRLELRCTPGFGPDSLELLPTRIGIGNGDGQGFIKSNHTYDDRRISRNDIYRGLRDFL